MRDLVDVYYLDVLQAEVGDGHSLAVWEAWKFARKQAITVPDWVLDYLDDCATNLCRRPRKSDTNQHIVEALRLNVPGGPGIWTRIDEYRQLRKALADLCGEALALDDGGEFWGIAKLYASVAEKHRVSQTNLEKAFREIAPSKGLGKRRRKSR